MDRDFFLLTMNFLKLSELERNLCLNIKYTEPWSISFVTETLKQHGIIPPSLTDWENAKKIVEKHKAHDIHLIPLGSKYYPQSLASVPNPPAVLFAKGNLELLVRSSKIAIVGSRSASNYGLRVTERITSFYSKKKSVIVSGLALGIDSVAHKSCLANHGDTIAVLAHGLNQVYPSLNQDLAISILNKNGLLVSEHPIGVEPKKHFFILRNRIQVGLSNFSIIVEAKQKSGTLSHVEYCLNAGHPLYVVVPHVNEPALNGYFEGNHWLIHEKMGIPLRSVEDYPSLE